jgi:hypothetical protein
MTRRAMLPMLASPPMAMMIDLSQEYLQEIDVEKTE